MSSSVEFLREFVKEQITAAELFGALRRTIVQLEESINRQRTLLDSVLKPDIKLHLTDVCKQEEVLCVQERSSSLDQEDPEPPQIKEEQEDICTSQEGEQLGLKQDTDALMLTPTNEESHPTENRTMCLNHDPESPGEEQSDVKAPFIIVVVSESDRDHQLLSTGSHSAESRDQKDFFKSHTTNDQNSTTSKAHPNNNTASKSLECDICGKTFSSQSVLTRHMRIHTGEKPYICSTCGRAFLDRRYLTVHMRKHTGEKPFTCETCGRDFRSKDNLMVHRRTHTGERPYVCTTCGKRFNEKGDLKRHVRIHTGEKPYVCKTCTRAFRTTGDMTRHMRTHVRERLPSEVGLENSLKTHEEAVK